MQYILAFIAFALCITFAFAAPETPVFPPAAEYQANITYTPSFYQSLDVELTGVMHIKNGLAAIESRDDLRTFEYAVFAKNTLYAAQKFGEFPAACDQSKLCLEGVSFVPPIFDAEYFKTNAKYVGQAEGLTVFEIVDAKSIVPHAKARGQFEFNPQGQIVNILQTVISDGQEIKSKASFKDVKVVPQADSLFQKPSAC